MEKIGMPAKFCTKAKFLLSSARRPGPMRGMCPSALTLVLGARQVLRRILFTVSGYLLFLLQGLLGEYFYFVSGYSRPLGFADFL